MEKPVTTGRRKKREDGYFWVILREANRIPMWTPAQFYNGDWLLTGVKNPVPESDLLIGKRIEDLPLPEPKAMRRRLLRAPQLKARGP